MPAFPIDPAAIRAAIAAVPADAPAADDLSGIIVPHHLLAADLIAKGYHAASKGHYERIIVLFPDHFFRTHRPFATTAKLRFKSFLGPVETDVTAAKTLLHKADLFERSTLFDHDHGFLAQLPFIRHTFPGAQVLPIAVAIGSKPADWQRAAAAIGPLLDARTLIVQSTDFSHYLPAHEARLRDQETLNLMAAGDLEALKRLHQPDHIDSLGALYLQLALQRDKYHAVPQVIANANSVRYAKTAADKTTSYVVAVFGKAAHHYPGLAEGRLSYFAGDTLIGRHFTPYLADELIADRLAARIRALTNGAPLILNLEGVMLAEIPASLRLAGMTMPTSLTLNWLKRLNVVAVSLANNHAMDLGPTAYDDMKKTLAGAGIKALGNGDEASFPGFSLAALSDLSNTIVPFVDRIGKAAIERLCASPLKPPLFLFVHWGRDGRTTTEPREQMLTRRFRDCAVSLIIGAQSHLRADRLQAVAGGDVLRLYSLGKFLFDQPADTSSGGLLEVRLFDQGTFFARLLPLPNFYELARAPAR